jgi:hypothetical protein
MDTETYFSTVGAIGRPARTRTSDIKRVRPEKVLTCNDLRAIKFQDARIRWRLAARHHCRQRDHGARPPAHGGDQLSGRVGSRLVVLCRDLLRSDATGLSHRADVRDAHCDGAVERPADSDIQLALHDSRAGGR